MRRADGTFNFVGEFTPGLKPGATIYFGPMALFWSLAMSLLRHISQLFPEVGIPAFLLNAVLHVLGVGIVI